MENCGMNRKKARDAALRECACDACTAKLLSNAASRKRCAARRKARKAQAIASPIAKLLWTARRLRKARKAGFKVGASEAIQLGQTGLTREQARTLLARHEAKRFARENTPEILADREARKRENSIPSAMRNGYRKSDTQGHVGEVEGRRGSFAAIETDMENVGMTHATMGFAYRETDDRVWTLETHGSPNRNGEMVASACVIRFAYNEGCTPGYGLRYKSALDLIEAGEIDAAMVRSMVREAATVGGFDPVAFETWLQVSGNANQERHGVHTPTTAWESVGGTSRGGRGGEVTDPRPEGLSDSEWTDYRDGFAELA